MISVRADLGDGTQVESINLPGPLVAPRIRGGMYLRGNADPRTQLPATGLITQYRGIAQASGALWPTSGNPATTPVWVDGYARNGGWVNLVVELKSYGSTAAQTINVEGRTYQVPAMTGAIQLGSAVGAGTPAYSYAQVYTGLCDGVIHRLLAALRPALAAGCRINIQLASEVDTDNQYGTRDTLTAADAGRVIPLVESDTRAVAAYSYIINWLRTPPAGVTPPPAGSKLTFSLGWAGQWSGQAAFLRCHPETLPVDVMHWNMYNHGANWDAVRRLNETAAYREAAGPRMRRLPVLIAEWGSNINWPGGHAAYIDQMNNAVRTFNLNAVLRGFGPIVGMVWFASRDATWGEFETDAQRAAGLPALTRCYSQLPFVPGPEGTPLR